MLDESLPNALWPACVASMSAAAFDPDAIALAEQVLPAVQAIALMAGREALALFAPGQDSSAKRWWKEGNSPVTEADLLVEKRLRDALSRDFAHIAWLSEEAKDGAEFVGSEPVFVVDPIDGTRAFMSGAPEWAISIALLIGGIPVMGLLHKPAMDESLTALAGKGAWQGKQRLLCDDKAEASHLVAGPKPLLDAYLHAHADLKGHPRIPSLASRVAAVAQNRLGLALATPGAHLWDIAAADLILREAGGNLTDADGRPVVYGQRAQRYGALVATAHFDRATISSTLSRLPREAFA